MHHALSYGATAPFFMAFVNSYSFSHRFNDDSAPSGYSKYQEIIHQSNAEGAFALAREFYCFALACGFAPQSIVYAFTELAEEYGTAHCDRKGQLQWQEKECDNGAGN